MLRLAILIWLFSFPLFAGVQGYQSFSRAGEGNGGLLSFLKLGWHIDAWFFDASRFGILVLDEGDSGHRYGDLQRAMQAGGCVAGMNGGYFADDAAHSPLGLLRHGGKTFSPLAGGSFTVSGVLYDTGNELRLERSTKLSTPPAQMREGIQGGPFLVEHGCKVRGLNAARRAHRSFVATDGKGNWCLGISSSLTLDELGEWLASGKALGNFRVQTALNMDGGTSSSFWVSAPRVYKPGVKAVRNYIGVVPRSAPSRRSRRLSR